MRRGGKCCPLRRRDCSRQSGGLWALNQPSLALGDSRACLFLVPCPPLRFLLVPHIRSPDPFLLAFASVFHFPTSVGHI